MRALGVDLGERRIGIALSDATGLIASPHSVLARSGDRAADHATIVSLARESGVSMIVVGVPRSLSGLEGPSARAALDEIDEIIGVAGACDPPIAVEGYDERLTTVVADKAMAATGTRARARRQAVDMVAAAVMLQGFLDSRR